MKWTIEIWSIKKLIDFYDSTPQKINLRPEYQWNEIWSSLDQRRLIESILSNKPLPSFFILKKNNNSYEYEMVDGQQRSRAIINFFRCNITFEKIKYQDLTQEEQKQFDNYKLNVTLISEVSNDESIEQFYALVNKTGLRLNRPELNKAQYYDTSFQKLCTQLAGLDRFQSLDLFSDKSLSRMNDIELVSELVAMLKYGIGEKKQPVDNLYEDDIDTEEERSLNDRFVRIVDILSEFDSITKFSHTRYKQRNDLYTLFCFINKYTDLKTESHIKYYEILVFIDREGDVNPSNDSCKPLQEYARNCVSQSNSKNARIARLKLFEELLRNPTEKPNDTQSEIIAYFSLNKDLIEIENSWTIDTSESD